MPELFTVRRFTRVLEAGKYGCPYYGVMPPN